MTRSRRANQFGPCLALAALSVLPGSSTGQELRDVDVELAALTRLLGKSEPRTLLRTSQVYQWVYRTVLEDPRVRGIAESHGSPSTIFCRSKELRHETHRQHLFHRAGRLAGITAGAPKAGAQEVELAIEAEAVVTAADTFALVVGEERVGTQIVSLERKGDGFVFREETISPLGTQTTEVRMSPQLTMRTVDQMGTMAGQEMAIQVTYDAGWAGGSARVPRRAGVDNVEVQSAVPDHVVDDNALIGLLPGMPLEVGSRIPLSVFQSGMNRLVQYVLTVEDAGSIEVPAGVYLASRVRAQSDDSTIVFLVRAEAPHRVLAVEPPGGPLRLVRIGPR